MIRHGFLSDHFEGVVVKRLSAVEADATRSNQHEYNGVAALKHLFGTEQPVTFQTRFVWLGDEQEAISEDGTLTWYDARAKHPTRTEYRMYFPTTPVSELASEGDPLFIAKRTDGTVMVINTKAGSTMENQLVWLFGLPDQPRLEFEFQDIERDEDAELDFAARFILDELGIEFEEPEADRLDELLEKFGMAFPTTLDFSAFARKTLPEVSSLDDPDSALLAWMEQEEALFRRLERRIVAARLEQGFMIADGADIDGFLGFSLSVQNRRKSRAGYALAHHIEAVLTAHDIRYTREATTEKKNAADFLLPGEAEYHDPSFPPARLTMLGAKTTCKDRWRQVLAEANRIARKHLLTLEPGISETQTAEMQSQGLQLVLPRSIHASYKPSQQEWLMDVNGFLQMARERQIRAFHDLAEAYPAFAK